MDEQSDRMTARQNETSPQDGLYEIHCLRDSRDIRLIEIQAASLSSDAIRMTMEVINLPKVPEESKFHGLANQQEQHHVKSGVEEYQALSYAWGTLEKTATIYIDGLPFQATSNLYKALMRFREKISGGLFLATFWIDAICINQSDLAERSKQVTMMGDIYHLAQRLTVWLGDASQEEVWDLQAGARPALLKVMDTPWFRRRWVLQEVLRARSSTMFAQYGPYRERFDVFCSSIRTCPHISASTPLLNLLEDYRQPLTKRNMPPFSDFRLGHSMLPELLANLFKFRETACSDPRDRIFSLMGISKCPSGLVVDYGIVVGELYMQVAKIYLRENVTAVMVCATITGRALDSGLPSWVPNWQSPIRPKTPQHKMLVDRLSSNFYVSNWGAESVRLEDDYELCVQGWVFQMCCHPGKSYKSCVCCLLLSVGGFGQFDDASWVSPAEDQWILWIERSTYGFIVEEEEGYPDGLPAYRLVSCFEGFEYYSENAMAGVIERLEKVAPRSSIRIVQGDGCGARLHQARYVVGEIGCARGPNLRLQKG